MQKDPGLLQEGVEETDQTTEDVELEIEGDIYDHAEKLISEAANGSATTKRFLQTNIRDVLEKDGSDRAKYCISQIEQLENRSKFWQPLLPL